MRVCLMCYVLRVYFVLLLVFPVVDTLFMHVSCGIFICEEEYLKIVNGLLMAW